MAKYQVVWKCTKCNKWYKDAIRPPICCPKCGAMFYSVNKLTNETKIINSELVTARRKFFKWIERENEK